MESARSFLPFELSELFIKRHGLFNVAFPSMQPAKLEKRVIRFHAFLVLLGNGLEIPGGEFFVASRPLSVMPYPALKIDRLRRRVCYAVINAGHDLIQQLDDGRALPAGVAPKAGQQ